MYTDPIYFCILKPQEEQRDWGVLVFNAKLTWGCSLQTKMRILSPILILLLSVSLAVPADAQTSPIAINGELDLSNWDFADAGQTSLSGEWLFAWQQLVDPTNDIPFPSNDVFPVPGVWNGKRIGETSLSPTGYASYQLTLRLPPNAPSLHVALPEFNMAYEFWANGQLLSSVGTVGTSASTEVAKSTPKRVQLPAAETVTLTLLISNHYHMEGGIARALQIDLSERILRNYELKLLFNFFTLGALFFLGLHYLIIYTYRHREIEHLLYGLLAWVFLLRLVVTNQLSYVVFDHPHIFSTRTSYLTMFLAPTLYVKFLHSMFPKDVSRWFANGMLAIGILGTMFVMVTQPLLFTLTRNTFTIVTQLMILYAVFAIGLAAYRRHQDAALVLILVVIFGSAMLHDTFMYQRLIESFDVAPFGFLAFMFGHAAILGRRINRALVREIEVSNELAVLTESLQQKVKERTSVLADKVALLQVQEKELAIAKIAAETANTAKTRFLYAASHDLQQPVHALNLFIEVLNERIVKGNWETIVEKMQLALGSLNKLLGDLGEVSRLESGLIVPNKNAFALHPYFESLVREFELICTNKGLQLRFVPTSLWCYSDPEMFNRIMRNLLTNAIKYTETGKILIGCRRRGSEISVEVWDTGVGIPLESQQIIFEEFHRVNPEQQKESSVGLGLSIVRQLSALLEHRLELESVPGSGSCFRLIADRAQPLSSAATEGNSAPFDSTLIANKLVLCIDDDASVRASMSELFQAWGAQIHCAANLSEAQRIVTETHANGNNIDLIITDYLLENATTGLEVIESLRDKFGTKLPPVIVVTAEKSAAIHREIALHNYDCLFKPMSVGTLTFLLAKLFSKYRLA